MAGRGYLGKHRQRSGTPVLTDHPRQAVTKLAVALAVLGTVGVVAQDVGVAGDVRTPATASAAAVAPPSTGARTVRSGPVVRRTGTSGDVRLGQLTVHFDATRAVATTIAGDDVNRRLSWTVEVDNRTGAPVTLGDPMAVLWATDGSGHLAMSGQRIPSRARGVATISFELPKALQPASITLTLGSAEANVKVTRP